ncbi:hypothetical protein [Actinoplanes solisilvae]|uniref:hypothetical protein n=1 Tax=Actinoplanes solisilvae TaxID=2486853 RepID=UPI000FD981DF|nr:hypothetical protein [Actinoplanes solisilvae]
MLVVAILLIARAQQYVTSDLSSIYNATPIMAAVMAGVMFRVETHTKTQIPRVILGILGVVVVVAR